MKSDEVSQKILKRIRAKKRGWVFTPFDFLNIAARGKIDLLLQKMAKQGTVRLIGRNIYDFPKTHRVLGILSPSVDAIAHAIARKTGKKVLVSGAMAANGLGLTTQVPVKPVFVTDGKAQLVKIGHRQIRIKHTEIPISELPGKVALILLAMEWLGTTDLESATINKYAKLLTVADKKNLSAIAPRLRDKWLRKVARQLSNEVNS